MRMPLQLNPFVGLASGQRGTLEIAPGYRLHGLTLAYSATNAGGTARTIDGTAFTSDFTRLEIQLGNKNQRTYTGEQLVMLQKFADDDHRNGFIQIPFSELDRNTINGEEALAWGTTGLPDPGVVVKLQLASGLYNPVVTPYVEQDDVQLPIGAIVKTYETEIQVSAAGWTTWKPDISRGDKIRRVHIKDSGHILEAEVLANNRREFGPLTAAANTERLKRFNFVPQSNWFHLVHDIEKGVLSNMDTVRPNAQGQPVFLSSLHYRFNWDAPGNYTAFVETIGRPD